MFVNKLAHAHFEPLLARYFSILLMCVLVHHGVWRADQKSLVVFKSYFKTRPKI